MDGFPYYKKESETSGVKRKRVPQRHLQIVIDSTLNTITGVSHGALESMPNLECRTDEQLPEAQQLLQVSDNVLNNSLSKPAANTVKQCRVSKRQAEIRAKGDLGCTSGSQTTRRKGTTNSREQTNLDVASVPEMLQVAQQLVAPSGNKLGSSGVKRKRVSKRQSQMLLNSDVASTSEHVKKGKRKRPRLRRGTRIPPASITAGLPAGQLIFPAADSCKKWGAKRIIYESRTFCCGDGTVVLATNPYPPQLTYLYTSKDECAVHFQKYSRVYNNVFAYSSIGEKIDCQTLQGIYVFKLHGQIYHHVPDLLPNNGGPRYLQLYFYDGQHEAESRAGCLPELRRDVVDILMQITSTNPYAKFFRSLREIDIQENTQIVINKNVRTDQRVYNAPTSDEVAVIWSENSASRETSGPHITVMGKTEGSHRILHYYGCYDPLQYPLLFPYGESGWHQGLRKIEGGCVILTAENTPSTSSFIDAEGLLEEEANRGIQPRRTTERI